MIIWINGPFGAGKTTAAELLTPALPGSLFFDPEYVGCLVRDIVPPAPSGDSQDLPVWRSLTVATAVELATAYDTDLVVPMTVVRRDYLDEIFNGLRAAGQRILHFFLTVDEDVLRRRIREQVLVPADPERDDEVREWRLAQVSRCLAAQARMPEDTVFLDSGLLSPHEVAHRMNELVSAR